jgi:hypothetical protein
MDLCAVKRHRPELKHAHLARQQQNLNEQPLDLFEKAPPGKRTFIVSGKRSLMAMVSWSGCSFAAMKRKATESYVARSSLRLENTPVA